MGDSAPGAPLAGGPLPAGIPSFDAWVAGVREGNRAFMARAITLLESTAPRHRPLADALLQALLPFSGRSIRIGISGVPGVGKSTFIEAFGQFLTARLHRVAVLAVDPSSTVSHGSILGDKTRMNALALDDRAFIRPSPTGGTLGGVARRTREAMLVCEAAGYDVVIVETVGVGQSETTVANLVDLYLVLLLAGAGDELQGIKKGILEVADLLAINKADGDNQLAARRAQRELSHALHYTHRAEGPWQPQVLTCSAVTGDGIEALWTAIAQFQELTTASGHWQQRRQQQQVAWMWQAVEEALQEDFLQRPAVQALVPSLESEVATGVCAPGVAARRLLAARNTV